MLRRLLVLSVLCLVGCPKDESSKSDEKASSEEGDKGKKKKKSDDDDSDEKKSKKKKSDDDDESDKKKPKDEPSSDDGSDRKASVVPEGTPIPPGCAPDPSGLLGAKPKLVTSAGQPGASMAIWQKEGEKRSAAITISADGKCYVDYLKTEEGPGNVATLFGYSFEKGAIQAVTGTTEKDGATIVGFKVTYTTGAGIDGKKSLETDARFYGYVAASGQPYSCKKIEGEKGDRCVMYQKPLQVKTSEFCKTETGGGPPAAPSLSVKIPKGVLTVPLGSASTKASAAPSTSVAPAPSGTAAAGGDVKCDGSLWCQTNAAMSKDGDHVYVRITAGKPKECSGGRIGDTWYFDESTWKKR